MTFISTTLDTVKADMAEAPGDEAFLLITGAKDLNGQSWCKWCELAKPDIDRVFGDDDDKHTLVIEVVQGELLTRAFSWLCDSLRVFGVPGVYRFMRGAAPVEGWEDVPLQPCWEAAHYQVKGGFDSYLPAWAAGGEAYEAHLLRAMGEEYKTPDQRQLDLDMDWDDARRFRAHLVAQREQEARWRQEKEEKAAKRKAREAARKSGNANKENRVTRVYMTRSRTAKKLNVFCDGESCAPVPA